MSLLFAFRDGEALILLAQSHSCVTKYLLKLLSLIYGQKHYSLFGQLVHSCCTAWIAVKLNTVRLCPHDKTTEFGTFSLLPTALNTIRRRNGEL